MWVKSIQTAGYNGARTVFISYNILKFLSDAQIFYHLKIHLNLFEISYPVLKFENSI